MSLFLNQIRVLDFTNNIAGPFCCAMLADMGAEVIHIEKPVWGDDSRHFSPKFSGTSSSYCYLNRGKKSLVLDLKDPEAVEIVKTLVKDTDILVESSRPGAMSRLGLGYEAMKAINPRLIYCSISAFGQNGPYAQRAGYDVIAQAYSGMMYYSGEPDGGPVKNYFAVGDFVTAYNAYGCIMTALYHRERCGNGQYVDVSLGHTMLTFNTVISDSVTSLKRVKAGNHDSHLSPYGVFDGPDGYIVIGAINVLLWQKLCRLMGRPELIEDPRYITNDKRCENQKDVRAVIEEWLHTLPSVADAEKLLVEHGVPCSKVYTVDDILNDEHANAVGWLRDFPLLPSMGLGGTMRGVYGFADFSDADELMNRAPELGENNSEILSRCGLSPEKIQELEDRWNKKK